MGLAERRAATEFETKRFPDLKKQVDAAACFEIPIQVDWETLAVDGSAHLYNDCWPKVYFEPLIAALKGIAIDDLGKEALRAKLTKVVIRNSDSTAYGDRMSKFENGVLTLDHKPCTNVDNIKDRTKGIQTVLEANL